MKNLIAGYERFRKEAFPQRRDHFHLLSEGQAPETLFLTCCDSRVVPDLILQTEPGDLFICRNIGNVVPPNGELAGGVSATIEYAVEVLKVRHIIICGHSDCGAIRAVIERKDLARLPYTGQWIKYIEGAWKYRDPSQTSSDPRAQHAALIHANVIAQLHNLKTHPEVARAISEKRLDVHGWYYDILTGDIERYDEHHRRFLPLDEETT